MSIISPAKLPNSHEDLGNRPDHPFQPGIILVDAEDAVSVFNGAAERILRLSPAPESFDGLPDQIKTLIAEARFRSLPVMDRSINIDEPAIGKLDLLVTALPMGGDTSRPAVTVILQDLTAGRQLQDSLQHLDRLANFGTLSAGIAHEIKNALVVGKTFFDLLLEQNPDAELVQLVKRELKRIETLVAQMVRYNTPARPTFAEVNLHEILDHCLLMVERQLKDKAIQLNRDYQAVPDTIRGDEFQLEQAFVNLLLNGIEAIPPHGRLDVRTQWLTPSPNRSKGGGKLEVSIEDTGVGISPEILERLFTPFFTTKASGTGLGLSITRRMIEQHGGSIDVTSTPGSGTRFRILLPGTGS